MIKAAAVCLLLAGVLQAQERTPVLVELFTSEGCSSCPPADNLLAELDKTQPFRGVDVIVLSEHVDYWNRAGWTDPFSSELFSNRQQTYGTALRVDSIYTPQVVIDGEAETVGSNRANVTAAILRAGKKRKVVLDITTTREANVLRVKIHSSDEHARNLPVTVALTENEMQSQVRAGENSGRLLSHVAVVRWLKRKGQLDENGELKIEIPLQPGWGENGLRVVAFLQAHPDSPIVGAGESRL